MENIPRIGVGVTVLTPNGYVFLKRQGSHGAGEWSFPGGHLEYGETVATCARREVMEELGVHLHDVSKWPVFTEDFFPNKHYITLYMYGYTQDIPKIMEPDKATDLIIVPNFGKLPMPIFSGVDKMWDYIQKAEIDYNLNHM